MPEKHLTKIEINLPITRTSIRILPKIKEVFVDTDGIGGCTYSIPSQPPIFKGIWLNPNTGQRVLDDIMWIYGCYDIERAKTDLTSLIGFIKELIESEAGEDCAWITYSSVVFSDLSP